MKIKPHMNSFSNPLLSSTLSNSSINVSSTGSYIIGSSGTLTAATNGVSRGDISNSLTVSGNIEIGKDIIIKGKSLSEALSKIEERLNILTINPKLESEFEELKSIGIRYRELEADILSKIDLLNTLCER